MEAVSAWSPAHNRADRLHRKGVDETSEEPGAEESLHTCASLRHVGPRVHSPRTRNEVGSSRRSPSRSARTLSAPGGASPQTVTTPSSVSGSRRRQPGPLLELPSDHHAATKSAGAPALLLPRRHHAHSSLPPLSVDAAPLTAPDRLPYPLAAAPPSMG